MSEARLYLGKLGLQDVDLLGCRLEHRLVACYGGSRARDPGSRLLGVLNAAIARRCQVGVAGVVLLGEGFVRLVDPDGRPGGVNHRLLSLEGCLLVGDRCLCCRDVSICLFESDFEVSIINAGQHLPGLDLLVVGDWNVRDIARHLWRDGRVVGLDISVVGRDLKAPHRPILPPEMGSARECHEARAGQKEIAPPMALRNAKSANPDNGLLI